ncbi:hypothetical protein DFH09DRAFT_915806 [Mycena vulgaris]|nr:hypothetical protein DFH09DRAFT_915806 [Mycena vulgaris]
MARDEHNLTADDAPFDPAAYIRKGKKFPTKNIPDAVASALAQVLKLPAVQASLIPDPNLPVATFLELPLPKKSSAIIFSETTSWFSTDAPTTSLECLLDRPIPPRQFLDELSSAVGQVWFDGCNSIVDQRYNDGRDRLPLSALTLWKELLRVVDHQRLWKQSQGWLTMELEKPDVDSKDRATLMAAGSLLATLGWNTKLDKTWTTLNLALFLSNAWLTDDHIDMMIADLSARVAADPELADKVLIAPLAFAVAIMNSATAKTYDRQTSTLLARYTEEIKTKGLTHLYFPLHVHTNHWIAGLVDLKQGLIGTGDSRVKMNAPPLKFVGALKRYLKHEFRRDFVYQGDTLEHGDQQDTTSCSILTRKTPAAVSIAVALGDHNFPDLATFALTAPRQSHPTLSDLMNPIPEVAPESLDLEMHEAEPGCYVGDHGDLELDDADVDEGGAVDAEEGGAEKMDVDVEDAAPTQRKGFMAYFGLKDKGKPSTTAKLGKRSRKAEADLDESTDFDAITPAKKPKTANGSGTSKSAVAAQKNRDVKTVAQVDSAKYAAWQNRLRTTGKHPDPDIKFHPTDPRQARHSLCGSWVTMGQVYEAGRWNYHFKTACPKLHPEKQQKIGDGLGKVPTLRAMGWTTGKFGENKTKPAVPCPGITTSTCPRLAVYLKRPGGGGGGARSVSVIAKQLFGKLFGGLKDEDKTVVTDTQRIERQWVNDRRKQRVFSTKCKKQVAANSIGSRLLPCSECSSVLGFPAFKRAIRRPVPDDENYIYVNEQYRNRDLAHIFARTVGLKAIFEATDAKNTPCIKFAQGTLEGKYTEFKVFGGLVESMVQKVDRVERGVGMQNFKHAPSWDEMAHIVNIHSPRAAKALREHFPLRSHRNFRVKEAREPRFPMEINDHTFALVEAHLAALKYDGPVALSCDDTKLFPSLQLYTDKEKHADFLVGGVDGPIRVADPEAMKKILADPKIVKGTKVRLWCLTIPLPGIAPIVVAAMPIHDMSADELLPPLEKILYGLLDRNICVISYACDGTETERSLQRKLVAQADSVIHYKLTSPIPGAPDLELVIAKFRGFPVVMIQDSKHALKTFRNNLFTGAKLLAMGNFTALFRRIYAMAMAPDSPLYHRDVERLDRQDDAAACRLFCAVVLEYLSETHPEYIGEIVYLFIFGELVDAYQSREISHVVRIKMALRARYFLDAWAKYLAAAGYKQQQYFLSREAVDIARYLIEGIISLVIVHRDHIPGTIPLLPWYHSSEPCEHTFGQSRDIIKDFSFLAFIFMAPKLRITMREAVLSGKASNGKAAAYGYDHSYFDTTGADLGKLAIYPSDDEIKEASVEAAAECDSLIALLGLTPGQLYEDIAAPLPGIGAWFSESNESEEPVKPEEEFDNAEPVMSEAEELQALIDAEERLDAPLRNVRQDHEIMSLTCASIAVAVDEHIRQVDTDLADQILGDEYLALHDTLASVANSLPALQLPSDLSKVFGQSANVTAETLDFKALVRQRREHQSPQAAKCTRIKSSKAEDSATPEESTRRRILRKYHELLKEDQTRAVGTTVERQIRWHTNPKPTAGNLANAAAAASAIAKMVCPVIVYSWIC